MQKDYQAMDDNVARMASYIIKKHAPAFIAMHLPVTDHAEHAQGRDGDQVKRAVAGADRAIRTVINAIDKAGIKETTAIIITGDHGFVNRHTNISINTLLTQADLITDIKKGDWKAQFQSAGGSAFLYLKDKNDRQSLGKVMAILTKLPDAQRKLFRIITKPEIEKAGADTNAVLAVTAEQGYGFDASSKGALMKPSSGGTHGYFPDFAEIQTGFIGYGAGFKKGVVVPVMELTDIAPIIAQLLGLDFKTPAGNMLPGILLK